MLDFLKKAELLELMWKDPSCQVEELTFGREVEFVSVLSFIFHVTSGV